MKISKYIQSVVSYFTFICVVFLVAAFITMEPGVALVSLVVALFSGWFDYKYGNQKTIKIKYFDDGIERVEKIAVGDWIDLRAAEDCYIERGELKLIRLGVGMILPDGYEAHVLPRSSTASKFGIVMANSMGIIDNSYSGDADEWKFSAVALRDTFINRGDRIAQFRIMKNQPSIRFEFVKRLNEKSRGGFGSTGTK